MKENATELQSVILSNSTTNTKANVNHIYEESHTYIYTTELNDQRNKIMIEWVKIKETGIKERYVLINIRNPNQNRK